MWLWDLDYVTWSCFYVFPDAQVESSCEKKFAEMQSRVNGLKEKLIKLRKALNKTQIKLAAERLEAIYRSDEDLTIQMAVTSARGYAKIQTPEEQGEIDRLQIECDVAEMMQEDYFGRFLFNQELAEVERKERKDI